MSHVGIAKPTQQHLLSMILMDTLPARHRYLSLILQLCRCLPRERRYWQLSSAWGQAHVCGQARLPYASSCGFAKWWHGRVQVGHSLLISKLTKLSDLWSRGSRVSDGTCSYKILSEIFCADLPGTGNRAVGRQDLCVAATLGSTILLPCAPLTVWVGCDKNLLVSKDHVKFVTQATPGAYVQRIRAL